MLQDEGLQDKSVWGQEVWKAERAMGATGLTTQHQNAGDDGGWTIGPYPSVRLVMVWPSSKYMYI